LELITPGEGLAKSLINRLAISSGGLIEVAGIRVTLRKRMSANFGG
jgi:hypothetical protein